MEILNYLFSLGTKVLQMFDIFGEFLTGSLSDTVPLFEKFVNYFNSGIIAQTWFNETLVDILSSSVGELVIGGGLLFVLGYKLVKFFVDLVL